MSTTERTHSTPSLKDRRVGVLRRKGSEGKNRIALDKPPPAFYWILVIVSCFVLLGLLMVLSSSSVTSLHAGDSSWDMFARQAVWVLIGGGVMWFLSSVPYDTWQKQAIIMVPTIVVVVLNVLVIAKGRVIGGATAWLDMGPFRFQPSEFMKLMVILFAANLLAKRHRAIAIKAIVLWPMLAAMVLACSLCIGQKDYGSAVIFAGTLFVMMVMAGLPMSQLAATGAALAACGAITLKFASRASERFLAFLDLEGTKEDFGYQVYQALLSISNGGWSGTGIGAGTSKWGYVPLAHSDFIFAVIAEELGIFGTVMVIGGFLLLVLLAIQVALSATDLYGAYIAGGVAAWLGIQSIVNIGGVVGVLPMTGLTLPFLSYGGSSMIVSMAAIGLLLNVARYSRR
jgi:cell division protein FtsW